MACNKQFLFFSQCFLPNMSLIFHFKCTSKCCQQFVSIWTSPNICCLVKSSTTLREKSLENDPGKKPFENIVGKGENAGIQHFLLYPQCFLPFQTPKIITLVTLNLSSAKRLEFCASKICSTGKELGSYFETC